MKNFYRGATGLLLLKGFLRLMRSRNNRSRTLFSVILPFTFFLLFSNPASAQEPRRDSGADEPANNRSLAQGDSITEDLWTLPLEVVNHSEGKTSMSLGDFRNKKVLILDFWATWCTTCLARLPRLHALVEDHNESIALIPVTMEEAQKVRQYFNITQNVPLQQLWPQLNSVVNGEVLRTYFPHRYLPHVIVIKNCKLFDIPESVLIDSTYITDLLKEDAIPDVGTDDNENYEGRGYYSRILPFPAKSSADPQALEKSGGQHFYCENFPIAKLYRLTHMFDSVFSSSGVVMADFPIGIELNFSADGIEARNPDYLDWARRNLFSYESFAPKSYSEKRIRERMREDLDFFLGVRSRVAERLVPVYALRFKGNLSEVATSRDETFIVTDGTYFDRTTRAQQKAAPSAKGNMNYMYRVKISRLLNVLARAYPGKPVYDETQIDGFVDVELPDDCRDFAALRSELAKQGFVLEDSSRMLNVLLLSKAD